MQLSLQVYLLQPGHMQSCTLISASCADPEGGGGGDRGSGPP